MADGEQARAVLTRLVAMRPEDDRAHALLAEMCIETGDTPAAFAEKMRFAAVLAEGGQTDAAIDIAREARALDPDNDHAAMLLARLHQDAGHDDLALDQLLQIAANARENERAGLEEDVLRRALDIDPVNADARHSLKRLYLATGRHENAIDVLLGFAAELLHRGDRDTADRVYESALEIDPDAEAALAGRRDLAARADEADAALAFGTRLADIAQAAGDTALVEKRLRELVDAVPDRAKAWVRLKDFYQKSGDTAKAAATLGDALEQAGADLQGDEREALLLELHKLDEENVDALRMLKDFYKQRGEDGVAVRYALRLAKRQAAAGDAGALEPLYREILALDARNMEARHGLADLYRDRGQYDEAAAEYVQMGRELTHRAEYPEAESALLRGLELDARREEVLRALLDLYRAQSRDEKIVDTLDRLAALAEENEEFDAAVGYYREIAALDVTREDAGEKVLDALVNAGHRDEAARELVRLAGAAAKAGDDERREDFLTRAVALQPDSVEAREQLGALYESSGRTEDGARVASELIRLYEKAQSWDRVESLHLRRLVAQPDDAETRNALIALYDRTGEADKAALLLFDMADAAQSAGKADAQIVHLHRVVDLQPTNEEAHRKLFEAYRDAGRNDEAVAELLALVDLNLDADRPRAAEKLLREVFTLEPNHQQAQQMLAQLFMRTSQDGERVTGLLEKAEAALAAGQLDGARKLLDDVLAIDPENHEARGLMNALYFRQPKAQRREVSEFFEDVVFEVGDQEDVELSWGDSDAPPPPVVEEEPAAAAEAMDDEQPEPAAEEDDLDLFAEGADRGEPTEAFEDVDVFDHPSDEAADDGEIDLFDEPPAAEEPPAPESEAEPESEATAEIDEDAAPNLFEEREAAEDTLEEEEADLFADVEDASLSEDADFEAAAPEPETGEPVVESESAEPMASEESASDLLDEVFGASAAEETAEPEGESTLDDLFSSFDEGETGEAPGAEEGSLAGLAGAFRAMVGDEAPKDASAHFALGIAFREMEQTADAIAEFEKALALGDAEKTGQIAYQLAQCYVENEDWAQGAEYLEMALDAAEEGVEGLETIDILVDLGHAYKQGGELKRALRAFRDADGLNTDYRGVKAEIQALEKKLGSGGDPDDNISFM
ncbi:MAG: tetratricopeptide repeat protein [Deltaproteobacteria bacterium]|nr:tetratricopeptide repeat protein [Deltaproteobacteria bacterium]